MMLFPGIHTGNVIRTPLQIVHLLQRKDGEQEFHDGGHDNRARPVLKELKPILQANILSRLSQSFSLTYPALLATLDLLYPPWRRPSVTELGPASLCLSTLPKSLEVHTRHGRVSRDLCESFVKHVAVGRPATFILAGHSVTKLQSLADWLGTAHLTVRVDSRSGPAVIR
jgi:hypothetical protein